MGSEPSAAAERVRGHDNRSLSQSPHAVPAPGVPIRVRHARDAEDAPLPPTALYVHVPFCLSICPYCDFVVFAGRSARGAGSRVQAFLSALDAELNLRAARLDALPAERPLLSSVYLGGGTPSLLTASHVASVLDCVRRRYGVASGAEVTIEANPGSDERGDFGGFAAAGITRVSLGAQSMDNAELRRLGRRHSAGDVLAAVTAARRAGIGSVSVDILYDIPGQTMATWRHTLKTVLEAGVDHVSAYALTLDDPDAEGLTGPAGDHLPTRPGARSWRDRARAEQDDDRAADLYCAADEMLAAGGFHWYELSNWARPGHESRHNLAYWHHDPYEAVGPGAHAFDGRSLRRWNAARLDGYLSALTAVPPRLPPGGEERLDQATVAAEEAILGLRLRDGIELDVGSRPEIVAALGWARGHDLLEDVAGGGIRLSLRGRLLSNELFARIVP